MGFLVEQIVSIHIITVVKNVLKQDYVILRILNRNLIMLKHGLNYHILWLQVLILIVVGLLTF
ncbi:hypothetical protein ACT74_04170 [Aggregatibacter actinomycetemcomitans]|nr:hypothetical protein ACT74_04170 [Aggregatibacter actinomycetemcomitans]KOE55679.1 hypothetical protein I23C_0301940 [Aggregatibacter actinomycetemcomitans serotype b str. I23C]KOE57165.1 hypothetical protein S23A_0200395 [Aggregatibacter actinomycetemcomitans serotype b str. S23A]TQE40639.1 hypothetical protein SC1000_10115 [Aggregatibacter actinomycetemcomitans]